MQSETVTKWLSDSDVARRYSVSRITIWRWTKAGHLPKPRKLGANTTRWHIDDLDAHDKRVMEAA